MLRYHRWRRTHATLRTSRRVTWPNVRSGAQMAISWSNWGGRRSRPMGSSSGRSCWSASRPFIEQTCARRAARTKTPATQRGERSHHVHGSRTHPRPHCIFARARARRGRQRTVHRIGVRPARGSDRPASVGVLDDRLETICRRCGVICSMVAVLSRDGVQRTIELRNAHAHATDRRVSCSAAEMR